MHTYKAQNWLITGWSSSTIKIFSINRSFITQKKAHSM